MMYNPQAGHHIVQPAARAIPGYAATADYSELAGFDCKAPHLALVFNFLAHVSVNHTFCSDNLPGGDMFWQTLTLS